jgi:retron-type reverse transcriptase
MRGVAWKESVQRFEANAMRNIAAIRRKLLAGENVQSGFVEFDLRERGKIRHIKSVHISERIVQKCLCDNVLTPILTRPLIYDNGASVEKKGVHFAIRRLIAHLSKFYRRNGFSNEGYALLIDFSKFFDNIRHDILFTLLERHIADPRILDLIRRFVSVFGPGKSLGLGSQVSQIAAIFYPNKLDHIIKEKLRIKYYGRYMDDLYLVHADKDYLRYCLAEIEKVCDTLGITINRKKTRIIKLSSGVNFLKGKYRLLPSGKILRLSHKDASKRMRRKLKKFKPLVASGKMSYADLRTAYQSWRGNYRKRFNDYYRIGRLDKLYNELFINLRP